VVIDLKTSRTVARLAQIGTKPDAVTFDPFSKRVFVMNNGGDNLTVVDAQTQQVIGSIPVGGAPESAQSDLKGRLFVNVEDKNQVKVIDTQSLKVLATWFPGTPCDPHRHGHRCGKPPALRGLPQQKTSGPGSGDRCHRRHGSHRCWRGRLRLRPGHNAMSSPLARTGRSRSSTQIPRTPTPWWAA